MMVAVISGLGACGGGGGGGGGGNSGSTSGAGATWSVANLAPWRSLAAHCAAPRSGLDPYTGVPYPDQPGTLLSEQDWLASWTNDTYLWYGDVNFVDPSAYASAIDYFNVLKSPLTTASGKPKDQYHYTYSTPAWEALASSSTQAGYGATWSLVSVTPPRQAVVAYTEPNSPATLLPVPLARGAQILTVDGVDLVNDATTAGVNTLNAGLFPATIGETHTFGVLDLGASAARTVTLGSANIGSTPVQNVKTLPAGASGGLLGYMLFNDHFATAEPGLINAVKQLQSAGITDLVLDMRYNGGGYLDIASELAFMIAGPAVSAGKTFDALRFNEKHPSIDPVTLSPITPTPFISASLGFTASPPAGQALPHLNLSRVYVLAGSNTASASEALMNGLVGVGIQVVQIGSTTRGKPYGYYPTDNCGTTYLTIQYQGVNQLGFGDYADGFVPQNGNTSGISAGAILPGCSVGDDFTHALGDPAELRLATALQYRAGGTCPAPTGFAAAAHRRALSDTEGLVVKSPFQSNRILRAHPGGTISR